MANANCILRLLCVLVASSLAFASNNYCGPFATRMLARLAKVQHEFPLGWELRGTCGTQWKIYGLPESHNIAVTIPELHVTIFNAETMHSMTDAQLDDVILHELGHTKCECSNEEMATRAGRIYQRLLR
jgi:hypothetical protein